MASKKVNVKTVKPESDEKVVSKVKKEKAKKEKKIDLEKREKVNKVLDEIKAFLLIDLIVFTVAFLGWYWYTHFYNEEDHKELTEEKEVVGYKALKYTAGENRHLKVLNAMYVIEYGENTLYKIMDMKNTLLYEGEMEYTDIYVGIDNEVYVTLEEESEDTNSVALYKLEDKELKEVHVLREMGTYYAPILYYENKNSKSYLLLGFTAVKSTYDETMMEVNKSYIYTLDGEEAECNDYQLFGDSIYLKNGAREIITFDSRYVVINGISRDAKKYGLYDLESKKVVIKPQYEGLFTNKDDAYIAIKNGKYGVVSKSLKRIVEFQYDFIDKNEDYYVVGLGEKMAIMDNNYKMLTKAEFDYQKSSENIVYDYLYDGKYFNTFTSKKIGNKYVLVTNNRELMEDISYEKHETYVISEDGKYEIIEANEFVMDEESSLIYAYDKESKVYTFYDENMKEKFKIDISGYDYDKRAVVSLKNENTIVIQLDSEIYYRYEDGKEIEKLEDYETVHNGVTVSYSHRNKEVTYRIDNKELAKVSLKGENDVKNYFVHLSDEAFYFVTDKNYIVVYKGE